MITKMHKNKILFLHGMFGQNSKKPSFLKSLGYEVFSPVLEDWNYKKAEITAQKTYLEFKPDLVVGSSRGAAIAINIDTEESPLLLLSPAWFYFGKKDKTKENSIIIHSEKDVLVPVSHSLKLAKNSNCEIIIAGQDHRLNCEDAKKAISDALKKL